MSEQAQTLTAQDLEKFFKELKDDASKIEEIVCITKNAQGDVRVGYPEQLSDTKAQGLCHEAFTEFFLGNAEQIEKGMENLFSDLPPK